MLLPPSYILGATIEFGSDAPLPGNDAGDAVVKGNKNKYIFIIQKESTICLRVVMHKTLGRLLLPLLILTIYAYATHEQCIIKRLKSLSSL